MGNSSTWFVQLSTYDAIHGSLDYQIITSSQFQNKN